MSTDLQNAVEAAVEAAASRLKSELTEALSGAVAAAPAEAGGAMPLPEVREQLFALFDGNGQVDVLNRLMGAIEGYWSRTVLFLIKGGEFQPWAVKGFEGGVGDAAAKQVKVPSSADTILAAALAGEGARSEDSRLVEGLGAPGGVSGAVPLAIRGRAAAVLYCDGPKVDQDEAVAAMEILARVTASSIELGMLTKKADPPVRTRAVTGELSGAGQPAPSAPVAEPEPASAESFQPPPAAEPEPEAPAATSFAPPPPAEPAPEPPAPAPAQPEPPAPAPAQPEAPSPAAAESKPAAPAAPAGDLLAGSGGGAVVESGDKAEAPAAKRFTRWKPVREQLGGQGEPVDEALASIPEPERQKHVEAKKIARLLVSEIKLYNEAKVAVGRKNGDLYERLKEDIDRSRQTYEQRVDPDVAKNKDYFREELIATLAEGKAELLGVS